MSETALQEFEGAQRAQLQRNEAQKMRNLVHQARGNIHRSADRWPFELTQNAHDPGPRQGQDEVNILLSFDGNKVVYEHDGKPFTMRDLAALLSGGSNKDFASQFTTGRFGTGFLLTHVLSEQIDFTGLLEVGSGYEKFALRLDRSGDEEKIYLNTNASYQQIRNAAAMVSFDGEKSASFQYSTDKPDAARIGLQAFGKVAPFLFGTCDYLGEIKLIPEDQILKSFRAEPAVNVITNGLHIFRRDVVLTTGATEKRFRALRVRKSLDSPASLVLVLEYRDSSWCVAQLPSDFPRLFYRFPIRASDFLPVNVVIDGRFDLSIERDSIMMTEQDKAQISECLGLLPALVQTAIHENWCDGFKLAKIGMPNLIFGDQLDEASAKWWKSTLSSVATRLAQLEVVQTLDEKYHKIAAPGPNADFVIPRFDVSQSSDELEFNQVWEIASQLKEALLPKREIAAEWTEITREWQRLDIKSNRLTLTAIAELVRQEAAHLSDLKTTLPPIDWLAQFLNLMGNIVAKHNCATLLADILPNQNNKLCSPANLKRDANIEEALKDIARQINLDIRSRLLFKELDERSKMPTLVGLRAVLDFHVSQSLTSQSVLDECVQELGKHLPDSKQVPTEKLNYRKASIELLCFLWKSRGEKAAEIARNCPLIASDGTAVRWGPQRKMMAPVSNWHKDAQPFAKVYKAERVLAEDYVSGDFEDRSLVEALVAWDMAFPDPLCKDRPREISSERLKPILASVQDEGVTTGDISLSQIALLPTELIQRCQGNEATAKSLLGLVLNYVARRDNSWLKPVPISAKNAQQTLTVDVYPALWIADLKTKSWVPLRVEAGWSQVLADAGTLKQHLLDPTWLEGNDAGIRLLAQFFGFKELDLRLLATAPSEELRKEMESGLSKIVQTLGANPMEYNELADALEKKKRQDEEKQRNRKFGFAVQEALKQCLESNDLQLKLVDHGYDYGVYIESESLLEAGTLRLELADYWLEVKATTTGEVRLTPTQAQTASQAIDRFVLCVVDLRGISTSRMEGEWTASDVEPHVKILKRVGKLTEQPHTLIEDAKTCDVGIRNDSALRYGVPVSVWTLGISVAEWIAELSIEKADAGLRSNSHEPVPPEPKPRV